MALEEATFQVGGVIYPIALTSNSFLQDADPAIFYLLDFYEAVLNLYLGPRWDAIVVDTDLVPLDLLGKVVNYKLPYDPSPFLTQIQTKFPLLALYSFEETYGERTRHWYELNRTLKLLYALPPLNAAQMEKLSPALRSVTRIILDRTEVGFDPNYNAGQQVIRDAGIEEMSIVSCSFGSMPGSVAQTNVFFPAVELTLHVKERRDFVIGSYDPLDGLDGYVQYADQSGDPNIDLIEFATDLTE